MVTRFCREHRSILLAALAWSGRGSGGTRGGPGPLTPGHVDWRPWQAACPAADRHGGNDDRRDADRAGRGRGGASCRSPTDSIAGADSPLNGILIGAGIGAIPGIYWLVVDPNECTGLCPEDYAAIAVGAVLGGLIDRAVTRKVTMYEAGASSSSSRRLLIGPLVGRKRSGVQLALRF